MHRSLGPVVLSVLCQCVTAQFCTCDSGTAAEGPACEGEKEGCTSCDDGYWLEVSTSHCRPNVCTCINGTAATEDDCPKHGTARCSFCSEGYHPPTQDVPTGECLVNVCSCTSGTAATGKNCSLHLSNICVACDADHFLAGEDCEPREECSSLLTDAAREHQTCGDGYELDIHSGTSKCRSQHCSSADRSVCCRPVSCAGAAIPVQLIRQHHALEPANVTQCTSGADPPCDLSCEIGRLGSPVLQCTQNQTWALRSKTGATKMPLCEQRAACKTVGDAVASSSQAGVPVEVTSERVCGHKYEYDPAAKDRLCAATACAAVDQRVCCRHELAPATAAVVGQTFHGATVQTVSVVQADYNTARVCSAFATNGLTSGAAEDWKEAVLAAAAISGARAGNTTVNTTPAAGSSDCGGARACLTTVCMPVSTYPARLSQPVQVSLDTSYAHGLETGWVMVFAAAGALVVALLALALFRHLTLTRTSAELAGRVARAVMLRYDTLCDGELNSAEFFAFAREEVEPAFFGKKPADGDKLTREQSDKVFAKYASKGDSMTPKDVRRVCEAAPRGQLQKAAETLGIRTKKRDDGKEPAPV